MDSNNNGLVINCGNGHVHVYLHCGHVMARDTVQYSTVVYCTVLYCTKLSEIIGMDIESRTC